MKKILLPFACVFLFLALSLNNKIYAQTSSSGIRKVDLRLFKSSLNSQTTIDSGSFFNATTLLDASLIVKLLDTINISSINVKITDSTSGTFTNFSKTFLFDVTGPFTDGTNYKRNGNTLVLHLGSTFMGIKNYTATVQLITNNGINYSPFITRR